MENSYASFTDAEIMHALITHDFSGIDRQFVDDVVTAIKPGAFYNATNLDTVSLPAVTKVGSAAFMGTSLSLLELTWAALTHIGYEAFSKGWQSLPENLTLSNVTELGNGAFAGTSSAHNIKLKSVSLPKWTGTRPSAQAFSASSVGVFDYCEKLESVNLPLLTTMTNYMFRGCSSLTEAVLPQVTTLASGIFTNCTHLTTIDIGGALTTMTSSFLPTGTSALEKIILRGVTTVPSLGSSVLKNTNVASGTAYIYVPSSLVSLFKVANNWSTYAAQIKDVAELS